MGVGVGGKIKLTWVGEWEVETLGGGLFRKEGKGESKQG